MGLVACCVQPSLNAANRKRATGLGVTRKAVYAKIGRPEPGLGAALARHTAARLAPVVAALGPADGGGGAGAPGAGDRGDPPARHRTPPRTPPPDPAVVLYEPASGLVIDAIPCEDGPTQERPLTPAILGWAGPATVRVGDRNVCTTRLLAGPAERGGCVVVRRPGQTRTVFEAGDRVARGRTDTGRG